MLARVRGSANSGQIRRGRFSGKAAVSTATAVAAPFTRLRERAARSDRDESASHAARVPRAAGTKQCLGPVAGRPGLAPDPKARLKCLVRGLGKHASMDNQPCSGVLEALAAGLRYRMSVNFLVAPRMQWRDCGLSRTNHVAQHGLPAPANAR